MIKQYIKKMNLTVAFNCDFEFDYFEFSIDANGLNFNIGYSQESITVDHWNKLIDAVSANNKYTLTFMDSNGVMAISTKNGMCYFEISSYGGYNCGECTVSVKNEYCMDAFVKARDTCVLLNTRSNAKN